MTSGETFVAKRDMTWMRTTRQRELLGNTRAESELRDGTIVPSNGTNVLDGCRQEHLWSLYLVAYL